MKIFDPSGNATVGLLQLIKMTSGMTIAVLLAGCAGFGVVHEKTRSFQSCSIGSNVGSVSGYGKGSVATNKAELIRRWGSPDTIRRTQNGTAIWKYKNGLAWFGVVPMVFIGIPLMFPVGNDYTYITIAHGRVQSCTEEYTSWSGFACGYVDMTAQGMDCRLLRD